MACATACVWAPPVWLQQCRPQVGSSSWQPAGPTLHADPGGYRCQRTRWSMRWPYAASASTAPRPACVALPSRPVTQSPAPSDASPARTSPAILAEAPTWLVLDKPAGWHSVDVRDSDGGPSVQAWLAREYPQQASIHESGLVQRLDRWTSGCVLVARSEEAAAALRTAVGGPALRKTYLALLAPKLDAEGSWALHFSSRHRGSSKVTVGRRGDDATRGECRWRLRSAGDPSAVAGRRSEPKSGASMALAMPGAHRRQTAALPPEAFDLAEIELHGPGRRHQIRAGFAFLGHPLAADALYGGRALDASDGPVTDRPALHAWRIVVEGRTVESPLPPWADRPAGR